MLGKSCQRAQLWRLTTGRPRLKREHVQGYVSLPAQMAPVTDQLMVRSTKFAKIQPPSTLTEFSAKTLNSVRVNKKA
jgi:hypothetical protein